jgi:hypothetical protein
LRIEFEVPEISIERRPASGLWPRLGLKRVAVLARSREDAASPI